MDTVILRNKRAARMSLAVKKLDGNPVLLQPSGYHGAEVVCPSFVKNHPDVIKMQKAGWIEIVEGPGDGDQLGRVTETLPEGSPLKSAETLQVPPGDGPVVPADPGVNEAVYLGDASNPLPPDMETGSDHVDPNFGTDQNQHSDHPRSRRKKHE